MIVFDLRCEADHRFEGWFASSMAFTEQRDGGLVGCPVCGSTVVDKAPMAPAVPAKGREVMAPQQMDTAPKTEVMADDLPPKLRKAITALAKAQAKALASSTWVGESFARKSRAMHYGDAELEAIHGKATIEEAKGLLDEGIEIAPLPFPVADPDELN